MKCKLDTVRLQGRGSNPPLCSEAAVRTVSPLSFSNSVSHHIGVICFEDALINTGNFESDHILINQIIASFASLLSLSYNIGLNVVSQGRYLTLLLVVSAFSGTRNNCF